MADMEDNGEEQLFRIRQGDARCGHGWHAWSAGVSRANFAGETPALRVKIPVSAEIESGRSRLFGHSERD
jgi:hypothetical protein